MVFTRLGVVSGRWATDPLNAVNRNSQIGDDVILSIQLFVSDARRPGFSHGIDSENFYNWKKNCEMKLD